MREGTPSASRLHWPEAETPINVSSLVFHSVPKPTCAHPPASCGSMDSGWQQGIDNDEGLGAPGSEGICLGVGTLLP